MTPAMLGRVLALSFILVGCAAAGDGTSASTAADTSGISVRVHYPAGWGHRITLHCSDDWSRAIETTWTADDVWVGTAAPGATCKPLLDDATWSIGANYTPQTQPDIWPHFTHQTGAVEREGQFHSNVLDNDRGIWIYTPPSYDENPRQTYPVVYMHDGQNLFSDASSFGGVSWNVGGAMDDGIASGAIPEAIVIGIENNADRMAEYTPVADPDDGGGNADAYLKFIVTELKPQVDHGLRTQPDAAHTAMIGSSLGGLVSVYAGLTHADTFGLVGALSPSTWWDNTWLLGQSQSATPAIRRIYIDSGNAGPSQDDVTNTGKLAAEWKTKPNVEVDYLVADGAQHNETYWRQRIPGALAFLLR
jgi:predicted alpha/beta superfamily hydrolase